MHPLESPTSRFMMASFAYVVAIWVLYQLLKALYNLSRFHPLNHIPGPTLARATYLPEFYYDVIKHGRYTKQIRQMHDKYGPIVRISPDELHCCDVNFTEEIYARSNRERNKSQHWVNAIVQSNVGVGTVDHNLHRLRRAPVSKFFSRGMIARLENDIQRLAQILCDKLLAFTNEPFDVAMAYSCFTTDSISSYCFGESFGLLDQDGWFPNFRGPIASLVKAFFVFRFFPIVKKLISPAANFINYLPNDFVLVTKTLVIDMPNMVRKAEAELDSGIVRDRPTVFTSLIQLDSHKKKILDLSMEAVVIIGAGTETTAWTLTVITYFLLSNPETLAKLTEELHEVIEDPRNLPGMSALEGLPYFQAVIQEGLRLSYGVSTRSPRIPTKENLTYCGEWMGQNVQYVIPKGYAIGMSTAISHHIESVFPDSYSFIPERWLDTQNRKLLDRALLSFSKGSRSCLGMNLAMCELNIGVAALTLRVLPRMRLFETTHEDVLYDHDLLIPMVKSGSKGVRVKIASS
ncbi:hypothetical protein AAE478_007493 [Parahypoxylon ruwenzoriense]